MSFKFFRESEVRQREKFYNFRKLFRIVVFVPPSAADKVINSMSKAGAGVIGNYERCSFWTSGTGTFRPNSRANPHLGKRNKLAEEEEYRIEMECGHEQLNKVIDSMLAHHPYEEVVYDILEVLRRDVKSIGEIVRLKRPLHLDEIISRLSTRIDRNSRISNAQFRTIAITKEQCTDDIVSAAGKFGCELLLAIRDKKECQIELISK